MPEQLHRREFTVTRVFEAPRDLVFQAWTRPEHLAKWWGPRGFTTPRDRIAVELREGGRMSLVMVEDAGGAEYPVELRIRELVPPERLVISWGADSNPLPDGGSGVATVTFADRGGKTEMTFHQSAVATEEDHRNAEAGWSESFDRFGEFLAAG